MWPRNAELYLSNIFFYKFIKEKLKKEYVAQKCRILSVQNFYYKFKMKIYKEKNVAQKCRTLPVQNFFYKFIKEKLKRN